MDYRERRKLTQQIVLQINHLISQKNATDISNLNIYCMFQFIKAILSDISELLTHPCFIFTNHYLIK